MNAANRLTPDQLYEHKVFDLDVITPIHIGSREGSLKATEFVVDNGHVHLINENTFSRWLQQRSLIDLFVEETKTGQVNLKDFLQKQNGWRNDLEAWTIRKIPVRGGQAPVTEFRPMIRDAYGRVFLPGSAIKGVFRTAVLWRALKNGNVISIQETALRVARGITPDSKRPGRWRIRDSHSQKGRERYSEWLQKLLLGNEPHNDLLRCLKVRDSYPVDAGQTEIIPISVLCKASNGQFKESSKRITIWVETVKPGTRFQVELVWDQKQACHPDWRPGPPVPHAIRSLDELWSCLEAHNTEVINSEKTFFANAVGHNAWAAKTAQGLGGWYNQDLHGLMRIGFGGGIISTTVDSLFDEDLKKKIRNACGLDRGNDPAPKSRRVWMGPNGKSLPMGWGRLVSPKEAGDSSAGTDAPTGLGEHPHADQSPRSQEEQTAQQLQGTIESVILRLKTFRGPQDKSQLGGILEAFDRFALPSDKRAEIVDQLLEPLSKEWGKSWLGKALHEWAEKSGP